MNGALRWNEKKAFILLPFLHFWVVWGKGQGLWLSFLFSQIVMVICTSQYCLGDLEPLRTIKCYINARYSKGQSTVERRSCFNTKYNGVWEHVTECEEMLVRPDMRSWKWRGETKKETPKKAEKKGADENGMDGQVKTCGERVMAKRGWWTFFWGNSSGLRITHDDRTMNRCQFWVAINRNIIRLNLDTFFFFPKNGSLISILLTFFYPFSSVSKKD